MKNPLLRLLYLTLFMAVGTPFVVAQVGVCDYQEPDSLNGEAPEEAALRQRYREQLAWYQAQLPSEPEDELLIPVAGVRVAQVADTWGVGG